MSVLNRRMFNVDPDHRKRIDYTTLPSTTTSNVQPVPEPTLENGTKFLGYDPQVEPVGLGPNDLMIDGKVFTVSPNFEEMVESREIDGTTLYPIINSPNAEFGSNVERILRKFTKEDVPFGLGSFESRGTFFRPEDVGSTVQDAGLDLLNILEYPVRAVAGFAGEVVGGPRGKKEFQSYIPNVPTDLERGLTKAGFIGELNDFTDDLEQVTQKTQESTEDPEQIKEKTQTSETQTSEKEPLKEVEESEYKDLDADNSPPPPPQVAANSLSNFFSSSAFNDALRNIGGSLVKEGRFGAGLASGAAGFANEQEAKSLLEQERMAKLMEAQAASGLSVSDKLSIDKAVNEKQLELATNVKDYNNALAGYNLANQVLDFANSNENLATFGAKFGAFGDALLTQAGLKKMTDIDDMTDTERAQVALRILTNANIKEILGESGRTISNIDRDIAKSVVGNLDDILSLDTLPRIKMKLEENLKNITQKGNLAQRQIRSNVGFLLGYTPNLFETDPEVLEIIQKDFGLKSEKPTASEVGAIQPRVIKSTLRG